MAGSNGKGKTAAKTAKSPKNGAEIPLGAHPGNTGGKKGRSGRKPDEFKALMREAASNDRTLEALTAILEDPESPMFVQAWKQAAAYGYGNPAQPLTGADGGPIEFKDVSPGEDIRRRIAGIAARAGSGNGAGTVHGG